MPKFLIVLALALIVTGTVIAAPFDYDKIFPTNRLPRLSTATISNGQTFDITRVDPPPYFDTEVSVASGVLTLVGTQGDWVVGTIPGQTNRAYIHGPTGMKIFFVLHGDGTVYWAKYAADGTRVATGYCDAGVGTE